MAELRAWQADALEKFLRATHDFLCVATPGAGKTRFALAGAERLIERGDVEQVVVVAPTSHMRTQWAGVAHREFGIQLDSAFANATAVVARDYDGIAVTYQSVAMAPLLYRRLVSHRRTLVILDEIHHGGDEKSWGNALKEAFEPAARRLLLSGTPDRTDGGEVPFVRYDDRRRFVADVLYDYGAALADGDGVVRLISFPTFDGTGRWLDAGQVESKLRLSEADDDTRAKVLRSALMPDGPWIRSVFAAANEELGRQRELEPDAGGLVIASEISHATAYRAILQQITGEDVDLAHSDNPDASDVIARFARGSSRWLVAVAMVSEGVDIPRLVVGVYATNKATPLFFRQVVGRFVRTRGPEDAACAALFIPSVYPLTGHAEEIERTIPRALKEAEERAEREPKAGGSGMLPIDIVVPLQPSEAIHVGTYLGGDSFSDHELRAATELGRQAGMSDSPVKIARLLRLVGAGKVIGSGSVEVPTRPVDDPQPSLKERKVLARKQLQRRVGYLARITGQQHNHIYALLNRSYGNTVPTATLEGLEKRLAHVERLIVDAQDTFGVNE